MIRCRDFARLRAKHIGAARVGPVGGPAEKARTLVGRERDRLEPESRRKRVDSTLARFAPGVEVAGERYRAVMRCQDAAQCIELLIVGGKIEREVDRMQRGHLQRALASFDAESRDEVRLGNPGERFERASRAEENGAHSRRDHHAVVGSVEGEGAGENPDVTTGIEGRAQLRRQRRFLQQEEIAALRQAEKLLPPAAILLLVQVPRSNPDLRWIERRHSGVGYGFTDRRSSPWIAAHRDFPAGIALRLRDERILLRRHDDTAREEERRDHHDSRPRHAPAGRHGPQ